MGACTYVGRVGGLALALGVGAAVLGGTAVGWADDNGATGSSTDHVSTQTRTPSRTPHISTSSGVSGGASTSVVGRGTRGAATPSAPAGQRASDFAATLIPATLGDKAIPQRQPEAVPAADPQPVIEVPATPPAIAGTAPVAERAPVAPVAPATELAPIAQPAAAPLAAPAAAVASVPTGALTALDDPLAGANGGGAPVDTPLDWTLLAYSRRNALAAASTTALPQAAATTQTIPIIMGPSGVPIPSQNYVNTVLNQYITNGIPGSQQVLFTPEGLYPITGVKSLPLNTSVDQGIQILSAALSKLPAGTPVSVFGYSQSAIISSLLQGGYTVKVDNQDVTFEVPAGLQDSINFVLVGNEMNPDGGFLSRFSGRGMPTLTLESLGIPFYGATPGGPVPATGVQYPTTNYTQGYDGFADFPRYPINLLADINAGLGIIYVHTKYTPAPDCSSFCVTPERIAGALKLPSTSASQQYYFIEAGNLPLLQPLREIKFLGIGEALADLVQPALKAIVDFGYADPAHGYPGGAQPNANQLQPFDFLPPWNLYGEFFTRFFDGIGQGVKDFIGDLGPNGVVAQSLATFSLPNLGPLAMGTTGGFISSIQQTITAVSDYISGAAAGIYAALLPTADVINALVTTLPAYATNLFLYGMQEVLSGDVVKGLSDAFGLPIAATVGLSSTAGLVAALVWAQGIGALLPGA